MLSAARSRPTQLWRSLSTTSALRNTQKLPLDGTHCRETSEAASDSNSSEINKPDILPPASDSEIPASFMSSPSTASIPHREDSSSPSTLRLPKSESSVGRVSEYDLDIVKKRLREWTEQATINLRHRADDFTARSKTTFSQLGAELNKVTGYEEIEALKKGVTAQEQRIHDCRQAAREAKKAYEAAVLQRSDSQREVNDLLQRKSIWTTADIARFTELVPRDHLHQQQEEKTKAAADEAEEAVEREFGRLMRLILARYHEEQVWSDKIRSASTYGSLAALGLNMLVFIMAILVVEPWKRKRLAQTFEDKIVRLSSENGERMEDSMRVLEGQIGRQEELLAALKADVLKGVEQLVAIPLLSVFTAKEPVSPVANLVDTSPPEVPTSSNHPSYWSRQNLGVAAVGAGAFAAGVLGTLLFSR